jgi:hypothetical protein
VKVLGTLTEVVHVPVSCGVGGSARVASTVSFA